MSLLECDAVVAIVDARDHVARGNMLIVGDRHGGDVAGHLGGDGKLARCNEGIVGRLKMPGVVPVEVGGRCSHKEEKERDAEGKAVPQHKPFAGLFCASKGLIRMLIFVLLIASSRLQLHDGGGDRKLRHRLLDPLQHFDL